MEESRKKKLLIFIVAYNAEKTIESVLNRIPVELLDQYLVDILIIDDSSQDHTFACSEAARRSGSLPFDLVVLYNPENQGYGGNQKLGFHYAIQKKYDWVALVHGDGQYAPECLPELLEPLAEGSADVVFGSRMLKRRDALKGGMPLYKFVGNTLLTSFQNLMLQSHLSEFHSGYRLYSVEALRKIPFSLNSNDFHFDTEIIIQLLFAGQRIEELPIPTFYGDEICHVNGMKYAWDVVKSTLIAKMQPLHIFYEAKYDCVQNSPSTEDSFSSQLYFDALLAEDVKEGASVLIVGEGVKELESGLSKEKGAVCKRMSAAEFRSATWGDEQFDTIFFLDKSGLASYPYELRRSLFELCRFSPKAKICVVSANIGFVASRLALLLGRFGYSRRGITNFESRYFFTLRSLKKLFVQYGFRPVRFIGLPAPWAAVSSNSVLQGLLSKLNKGAISISPSLFAFIFVFHFQASASLDWLLLSAENVSARKIDELKGDEKELHSC